MRSLNRQVRALAVRKLIADHAAIV
jgi:hypothetical protein